MKKWIGFTAVFAILLTASASQAILISTAPVDLWDVIPGASGYPDLVYCQYYNASAGTYNDLSNSGTMWQTYLTGSVPQIQKMAEIDGDVRVKPAGVSYGDGDLRPVIKVGLEGSGTVNITGSVYANPSNGTGTATASFSIFKNNLNNLVWTSSASATAVTFDAQTAFVAGDNLLLVTSISDLSGGVYGQWFDVQFTQIPEPVTVVLLALGSLMFRKRK